MSSGNGDSAGPFSRPPAKREVAISVRGASRKFCRDLKRSLRYTAFDAVEGLFARRSKVAALRPGEFWALRNVSFDVRRGESVGVMGLNGAGKSTLLKLMLGSLRLTEGEIVTSGRLTALSEQGLGFDPVLTGRENIYMTAAVLETGRRRVDQAFDEIVAFAGIQEFLDSPVRAYSTGMRARLGFSIAMHLAPDVLLVDEVLAVGDIGFQRQCIRYARRYLEEGGSLVLVSHNPHLVQFICDRCIVLDHGNVVVDGSVVEGVARYMQATRTAPGDPLALDAALAGGFQSPCEGSGVEIDDFGVEPAGSPPPGTGTPVRVYVRYRTCRPLDIRWGFCLLTPDLATTIACEGLLEPFPIQAGAGELAATVPRLPLAAGRYALRVAIMDPHTELPLALGGFYTPPRYFTIETPASIRDNYRMFTDDLVALEDLKWELQVSGAASVFLDNSPRQSDNIS
jgi:lipopolysaccharide transport system ATP-binding protein